MTDKWTDTRTDGRTNNVAVAHPYHMGLDVGSLVEFRPVV